MRAKKPIVSILVPVYGVEQYIEECVRSLLEQSYEECRYIFVDDASQDRSIELLRATVAEYPHRAEHVRIASHDHNRGLGAARNTLFDMVTQGEFVMCVDSDDYLDSHIVEALVTRAIVTRADAVRCGRVELSPSGQARVNRLSWLGSREATLRAILAQSHLITSNIHGVMVRRELIERAHIRVAPDVNMGEDYTFIAQVLYHAKRVATLDEPLYIYRTERKGSYMDSMRALVHIESYIRANVWVTEFIESQADHKSYYGELATAKINIKKWIALRGVDPKRYNDKIFGSQQASWTRPLALKLYNKIVDLNIILLIRIAAAIITLPLVVRMAWHKVEIKNQKRREIMWGK